MNIWLIQTGLDLLGRTAGDGVPIRGSYKETLHHLHLSGSLLCSEDLRRDPWQQISSGYASCDERLPAVAGWSQRRLHKSPVSPPPRSRERNPNECCFISDRLKGSRVLLTEVGGLLRPLKLPNNRRDTGTSPAVMRAEVSPDAALPWRPFLLWTGPLLQVQRSVFTLKWKKIKSNIVSELFYSSVFRAPASRF